MSVMAQYRPCFKAHADKRIARRISAAEYKKVVQWVKEFGFENAYCQELSSSDIFLPDFNKENPFE